MLHICLKSANYLYNILHFLFCIEILSGNFDCGRNDQIASQTGFIIGANKGKLNLNWKSPAE